MRYYNNLRKFEEIRSFKRFKTDPIPGVDVVVEKIPPGNNTMVGINDTLPEDIEEAYGVTINTNSLTTSQKKKERFNLKIDPSPKFSSTEFDLQLENISKTINQNAIALSYVMNQISGGIGSAVKVAVLELSTNQIRNISESPVAFGLTPASGKTIIPISAFAHVVYGGIIFENITRLLIRPVGQSDVLFTSANGLLSQTSDTVGMFVMQGRNFPPSTDFEVYSVGNPLNGNGTATVYLHYIEVTI